MKPEAINKWLEAKKSLDKLESTNNQFLNTMEEFNKAEKKRMVSCAKVEITRLKAMKVLASNNDLACEICVAGMRVGLSRNTGILPILNAEIKEIQKFLDGKPNNWE